MRLTSTVVRRSLFDRPARTLFCVLGIAMGIATVVGIFTLDHNTILGLSQPSHPGWKAEIEVTPAIPTDDPKAKLRTLPGVAGVTSFFQNAVVLRSGDAADKTRVQLFALEADDASDYGFYDIVDGRDLGELSVADELLVGEPVATKLGLGVGDFVTIARPKRTARKACIEGEIQVLRRHEEKPPVPRTFRIVGILARTKLGRRARGQVVVCDLSVGRQLFEGVQYAEKLVLKRDPSVDIERLKSSLSGTYSYELDKNILVGQAADERAFRNGVRFAGLVALVLGLFIIFHTLSVALIERMKEIATLHALGATNRQIGRIFFVEALLLAGLGAALGLGLGLGLAKFLLSENITTLGLGKHISVFEVPWGTVIPLVLLGAVIALLGSIYPLLRLHHGSTLAALRGEMSDTLAKGRRGFRIFSAILIAGVLPLTYLVLVPVVGEAQGALIGVLILGTGIISLLAILPLLVPRLLAVIGLTLTKPLQGRWPLSGRLAAQALTRQPARISVAVIGIALVTAAFVGLRGMTASLRQETVQWAKSAVDDKVFISGMKDPDVDTLREILRDQPQVIGLETGDARAYSDFLILGLATTDIGGYGTLFTQPELLDAFENERGIILTDRLARDIDKQVGDTIAVQTGQGPKAYPIIAIGDDYGFFPEPAERLYGVVSETTIRRDFCLGLDKPARLAVRLREDADLLGIRKHIKKKLSEALPEAEDWNYNTGDYVRAVAVWDIDRDFLLFDIIIGLTAVLAVLGVLNGQLLAALERFKELGILRALGTTNRQITGMVAIESAVVGVLGGVLGVTLGAGLTPVIVAALRKLSGLDLPHAFPTDAAIVGFFGAVGLALIAAIYPIRKMQRMDPVRAVRSS